MSKATISMGVKARFAHCIECKYEYVIDGQTKVSRVCCPKCLSKKWSGLSLIYFLKTPSERMAYHGFSEN